MRFSAKFRYILPQKEKFKGEVNMHTAVLNAVRDTESSVFPLDNDVMTMKVHLCLSDSPSLKYHA